MSATARLRLGDLDELATLSAAVKEQEAMQEVVAGGWGPGGRGEEGGGTRRSRCSIRAMDLDEILPDVGEFGAYQQLLLWFVLLPGVLPCGFHAYNQLFMAASPPHWCHVPELDKLNISQEWARNLRSVNEGLKDSNFL